MILAFTLNMPSRNSWNGKWSGDERCYVILKTFKSQKACAHAAEMVAHGSYHYNWSDGWGARIDVSTVGTSVEAARLRKKSNGFCGYDWMVDSIINYGIIMDDAQVKAARQKQIEGAKS